MSYDVAFWAEKSRCSYGPYSIYLRLRRGLNVDGLKALPASKVRSVVRTLIPDCRDTPNGYEGSIGPTHVEVTLREQGVLMDFRHLGPGVVARFAHAFDSLGLSKFDPSRIDAEQEGEFLYDEDYRDLSGDPDVGYWVNVDATSPTTHYFADHPVAGAQQVNGIEYVFLRTSHAHSAFKIHSAITDGKSSIQQDRMNGGMLSGSAAFVVFVVVPASVISHLAGTCKARDHISIFTAFGDDDRVLAYVHWKPNDNGSAATVVTLPSMPKRLKTILSTRFSFKG